MRQGDIASWRGDGVQQGEYEASTEYGVFSTEYGKLWRNKSGAGRGSEKGRRKPAALGNLQQRCGKRINLG